ncbi:MAG: anti-sigma factor antagonist [Acidobacteria bacterium]|nr:MAG: anti-sigma factor antagonist [Acidobacteriota bacterium]
MSLAISSRIVSGVIVVDIVGRLCFLNVTLRDRVNEWLQEGHRAFVFNLANVPYADSFGLGQLITISNSVRSKGGQLILLGPTDHVRALFQITKLNTETDRTRRNAGLAMVPGDGLVSAGFS